MSSCWYPIMHSLPNVWITKPEICIADIRIPTFLLVASFRVVFQLIPLPQAVRFPIYVKDSQDCQVWIQKSF